MKNAKGSGESLTITCPSGGLSAGVLTQIKDTIVVPLADYAEGEDACVFLGGSFEFVKDTDGNPYGGTGFAAEPCEYAYWDKTSGLLVSDSSKTLIGVYADVSVADDDTAVVILNGFLTPTP